MIFALHPAIFVPHMYAIPVQILPIKFLVPTPPVAYPLQRIATMASIVRMIRATAELETASTLQIMPTAMTDTIAQWTFAMIPSEDAPIFHPTPCAMMETPAPLTFATLMPNVTMLK